MFRSSFGLQTINKLIKSATICRFSSYPYVRAVHSSRVWHISARDEEGYSVHKDPTRPPKLFVVQPRLRPDTLLKSKLDEALNLANSLEEQRDGVFAVEFGEKKAPPHLVVQNPAARSLKAHADTYFGPGTVETVKYHVNAVDSEGDLDAIFVNSILSGVQQRNLEATGMGRPVLDRVGLIIEIFNAHAQTKEAKLQSELAALMYKRTRLVRVRGPGGRLAFGAGGEAEVVSARGRASGGRGFISGAGETELQLQRRRILERRNHLLALIEEVRRTRALQRAARKRRGGSQGQGLSTVAVVGYTNAGKSTLVSALSETVLYKDDRLFATVDPHVRSVILPSGRKVLLSDTVGFISDLPVQLIEAFHATLEEVVEADLLVHVLDSSAFNLEEHRSTVLQVLQQIGVSEDKLQNMIEVWNKIDLLEEKEDASQLEDSGGPGEAGENFESLEEDKDGVALERSTNHYDEDEARCDLQEDMDKSDLEPETPCKPTTIDHHATDHQPSQLQHVKASAVLGIGLQELLKLIDDKLRIHPSPEGSFDRKWRPPAKDEDSQME